LVVATATREVIIVYGVEFRDQRHRSDLETFLDGTGQKLGPSKWVCRHGTIDFQIEISFTKADFAKALDRRGAIVIYDGHARFGQGPAFSDQPAPLCPSDTSAFPVNPWEDHFRMGFDVLVVPAIHDILEHATNPKEFAGTKAPPFAPSSVRRVLELAEGRPDNCRASGYAKRALAKCFFTVADQANCRGVRSLRNRHYWRATNADTEFETLVEVGSADLAVSKLACAVLFLNSCSSLGRFGAPLQRHRRKVKSKCVFYLTRRTSYNTLSLATNIFIELLLKGVDPTTASGSRKLVRKMNSVNPGIQKSHGIKHASGIIQFRK
jgi:hypothetical protein